MNPRIKKRRAAANGFLILAIVKNKRGKWLTSRPSPSPIPPIPDSRKNPAPSPKKSHENQQVLFGVCKSFLAVIYKQQKTCSRERSPRRLTKICEITYKLYETNSCYFCFLHLSSEANLTSKTLDRESMTWRHPRRRRNLFFQKQVINVISR